MDLATYFARYPNVRFATPGDNEKILAFYRKLSMQGGAFNILFVKDPDYFRFLRYESATHAVGLVEDDDGNTEGMFTFAVRPCYVNGRRESTVHISDLRFSRRRERKTKFDWKMVAVDLCAQSHTITEFAGARYLLGSFVMANKRARQAIASQKTPFDISPIANYKMVNLLARKPFGRRSAQKNADLRVDVSRGTAADQEPLRAFLDRQHRRRALGYVFEGPDDELARRLGSWAEFTMASFFIARDSAGAILGCFAPWDLSPGRRIVVDRFPAVLAAAATMLRPLIKKIPRPGEDLRILYLTTQEIDLDLVPSRRDAVFRALLDALDASGLSNDFHMVALCDYDHDSLLHLVAPRYFAMKTDTMLYQLCERGNANVVREETLACHAGHEMCLT
ncbi:MAG TPA: hypothetical protein VFH73_18760 [Polyangia bacterium]|jgi:hypothetical protein|nr:hypothetical protein [Polyangia bacterium]